MRLKLTSVQGRMLLILATLLITAGTAFAQSTAFTYQGRLTDQGAPANGTYDFKFRLLDEAEVQQGPDVEKADVQVTNGVFTVQLNFGSVFDGGQRYLEMSVRPGSGTGTDPYTTLTPRQEILSTPYAITSANFTGNMSGDVTGTQNNTVVASVGGQSASVVASSAAAINSATSSNTPSTLVKRDASGNFSAGTITASLNGNATTATTASGISSTAGDSVVTAVNASSSSVNTSHVAGDVELLPADTQTATLASGQEDDLIDVQLNGGTNTDLGTSGTRDLLSLKVNGTFRINGFPHARDMERFRVDNAGGILSVGGSEEFEGSVPMEGSGARFMWYPGKRAIRAGYINGTQWDDANIGLYSAAFGYNARASGDYGFAVGQDVVAANSWSIAMGHYVTGTGAAAVALGYYAHTNSRQGSFVFSDRSVLDDNNIATDESFKSANNHTFNVRATGGYYFFTNTSVSTGLRMSHLLSNNASYGSFVWTDRSSNDSITPTAQNQTIFRSDGGYWLYSNAAANAGVTLAPGGGSWNSVSDRNMKANFAAVNPREVLRGVLGLPISTWNYKSQNSSVRHIGPMAQDFFATFKVGEGDKTISTIDPDGVALAAIQGLNEEIKDRDVKIEEQQRQVDRLQQQLNQLQRQVTEQQSLMDGLRQLVCQQNSQADVCKIK